MKKIQKVISDYELENNGEQIFLVFDENNNVIFERSNVVVGDIIIDKNFNEFEIINVDTINKIAHAKFIKTLEKPNVNKNISTKINTGFQNKKIGLYLTHNDESYIDGDGYSSIYGEGGIHDVANYLGICLQEYGIEIMLDETLHIPHDSKAYSRSKVTANKLLNNEVSAIFDIHRDGASRKTYVKTVNGTEKCMVRIVVGQANPNKEANLQFALYLMSVAEDVCPWLFLDIYYAYGEYNQSLTSKALLFEMGSHLVEKDLVLKTVPQLAKVINTTLFKTTVNETDNELTINNTTTNSENTVDKVLETYNNKTNPIPYIILSILLGVSVAIVILVIKNRKNLTIKEENFKK